MNKNIKLMVTSIVLLAVFSLVTYVFYPVSALAVPNITFADTSFNFGQIYQNHKVDHIFSFKNTGDQVLNIDQVKTSCGCTAAILSEKAIKPGESGEIKITFNSAGRQGSQKKIIYVHSNDPAEPVVQLVIEALVKVDLEASPPSVYFNQVQAGQKVTQEVSLKNTGEKELSIRAIETAPSLVIAKIHSEETKLPIILKTNTSLTIMVEVESPINDSRVAGRVTIRTDSQTTPEVIIPVTVITAVASESDKQPK